MNKVTECLERVIVGEQRLEPDTRWERANHGRSQAVLRLLLLLQMLRLEVAELARRIALMRFERGLLAPHDDERQPGGDAGVAAKTRHAD